MSEDNNILSPQREENSAHVENVGQAVTPAAPLTMLEFLKHILPSEGFKCCVAIKKGERPQQHFTESFEGLARIIQNFNAAGWNAYFACSTFVDPSVETPRGQHNVHQAKTFWQDIDYGNIGHAEQSIYPDLETTRAAITAFCSKIGLPVPTAVSTGGGVHAYWLAEKSLAPSLWLPQARVFKQLCAQHGLDVDTSRSTDMSSILRVPGTFNYKLEGNPRPVECLKLLGGIVKFDTSIQPAPVAQAFGKLSLEINKAAAAIYTNTAPAYAEVAANKCSQLRSFRDTKGKIREPVWYACLGVLGQCADGDEKAQLWSSGHLTYTFEETAKKIDQARTAAGATTCEHFKDINPAGCAGCPFSVTSPIQLGRAEASSVVVHNYADLEKSIEQTDDVNLLTSEIANLVTGSRLKPSDIFRLRKMIARKAGVKVSAIEADAKNYTQVEAQKDEAHVLAAQEVINFYCADNLLFHAGNFWVWRDKGVWEVIDDRDIKQTILKVAHGRRLTKNVVESILDMVKTYAYIPDLTFNHNDAIINCVNGELHFVAGDWVLKKHDRKNYQTTQIPVSYDPTAKCPRFGQFLSEVFAGDDDRREKAFVVAEGFGYSLLKSCRYEKFFILYGLGANGKSVLLGVLVYLLGKTNISAVQPSQFENRFQRGHLCGKLANIVTEIPEGSEIADAQLKSMVSGEMTTAEQKYKPPFDFVPFATMWFGTNHMPHTRDFSDALFRRAIILKFNNKFEGNEQQDTSLKEKLNQELPGIFNFALIGLRRLFENNGFTSCPSNEEAKQEWRKEADQAAQFVEDECEIAKGTTALSYDVYCRYRDWAERNGIKKTLSRKNFTARLKRFGIYLHKGAQGSRWLEGVILRPIDYSAR